MKTTLKFLLICILILFYITTYSQGSINLSNSSPDNQSSWQVYKHSESVDIYCKKTICKIDDEVSFEYMLFKVVNTSNQSIEITWDFKLFNNDQEIVKSPDDLQIQLTLEANGIKEGDCQVANDNKLKVLVSEQSGPAMITSIDLINIKVSAK